MDARQGQQEAQRQREAADEKSAILEKQVRDLEERLSQEEMLAAWLGHRSQ